MSQTQSKIQQKSTYKDKSIETERKSNHAKNKIVFTSRTLQRYRKYTSDESRRPKPLASTWRRGCRTRRSRNARAGVSDSLPPPCIPPNPLPRRSLDPLARNGLRGLDRWRSFPDAHQSQEAKMISALPTPLLSGILPAESRLSWQPSSLPWRSRGRRKEIQNLDVSRLTGNGRAIKKF